MDCSKSIIRSISVGFILVLGCNQSDSDRDGTHVPAKIDFNFHVRPILSDRCFACHGPDEKARESELRLDLMDHAFAPIDSLEGRYAIVPGDVSASELVQRIHAVDPDEMMPPPSSNLSLAPHEKEILQRWIEQGAEWKDHWAFIPPEAVQPPKISGRRMVNAVDKFIAAKQKEHRLKANPPAAKEKLIRRLSFDLRGLPPSIEEIRRFRSDPQEDAYERLVDQFLGSQAFGERMAMEWLDLARYADSHGYQDDLERSMWPWRDWVIQAFNQNLPYDQFVTWQLAGDLLEGATYEQKLATAFNRNHKITQEVGVVNEEYRVTYVLDRINTFSTSFLGMTIECAQCHDHKYDPISQREYYQLFSFFNNVPEKGRVDYGVEVAEPSLPLPEEKVAEIRNYVETLLDTQRDSVQRYVALRWKDSQPAGQQHNVNNGMAGGWPTKPLAWFPLDYIENNEVIDAVGRVAGEAVNDLLPVSGKYGGGVEFTGTNYGNVQLPRRLDLNQPFSVSFWLENIDGGIRGAVLSLLSTTESANFQIKISHNKDIGIYLGNKAKGKGLSFTSKLTVPQNQWTHYTITYDGSRSISGLNLYMNGQWVDRYENGKSFGAGIPISDVVIIGAPKALQFEAIKEQKNYFNGAAKGLEAGRLDELLFFNKKLSDNQINALVAWDPHVSYRAQQPKSLTVKKSLFYQDLWSHDPQYRLLNQLYREYKIRKMRTRDIVVKPTMVMQDMDTIRPTFVLDRGQYDAPRERVTANTPNALTPYEKAWPKNRLGLAQWLFSPDHPLTARVAVNRYWQMIFGRGIVTTPGDFGSQGALPSHPELLDWLAGYFRDSDWDVKNLIKLMVMSATYRQSVANSAQQKARDPDNVYLSRGPQTRLSAEMIRDHALASSGLLAQKIGGPSVKPYQPQGLWLEVASGNQSLRKYIQDHNADLYRRSLYTFWKRTLPPPSMIIFDAPSREQCVIGRTPTSTPMQALVMLNDPQFVEAARFLAVRMINQGGSSIADRIAFAFQLLTSRLPTDREKDLLLDLFHAELADFSEDPSLAEKLLDVGEASLQLDHEKSELAAYTVVASAILNTTETILKS